MRLFVHVCHPRPSMSDPVPALDFTQIRFPSDRITIGQLRKLWPGSFDEYHAPGQGRPGDIERAGNLENTLGGLIDCERVFANLVFLKALGLPRADGDAPETEGEASDLAEDYATYGWAGGWHEAREMVRDIESQVLAQVRRHAPPGP